MKSVKEYIFIDFYEAMTKSKPELIEVTELELIDLIDEFFKLRGIKKSDIEIGISNIDREIIILNATLVIFQTLGKDEEILNIFSNFGIKYENTDRDTIIQLVMDKIKSLIKKRKILETNLPPRPKNQESQTGYDILASLSVGLEMNLGSFKIVTVGEFLAYTKVADEKAKAQKKSLNKKKRK